MSKSNAFETDLLALIFNGTDIPNLADDTVTAPAVNISVALHTADPTESGNQASFEANYGSYGRVDVVRSAVGWTVGTGTVSPAANITFPTATSGSNEITFFSVGTGVGDEMLYSGTVLPNISVTNGVAPSLTTASTITED